MAGDSEKQPETQCPSDPVGGLTEGNRYVDVDAAGTSTTSDSPPSLTSGPVDIRVTIPGGITSTSSIGTCTYG